jgi:uncharacterized protein (TIGR03086 family)
MGGPSDIWRVAADKWTEVHSRVGVDHWDIQTPCDEWNVRELVDHNLQWQARGGALLGASTTPGDNWETIRQAYAAHLSDASNRVGTVPEFAGIPKGELAAFMIGDLLIHSWDLARSIGADETLPPTAVEATMVGLHHVPPELLRGHNPLGMPMMGLPVEISDDASLQDRMLAFTGRRP